MDGRQGLLIQGVLQNGAVAAWNKQCCDGTSKRLKALWPGDTIVNVNGKVEHFEMIHECKTKMLLKLTVVRAVGDDGARLGAMNQSRGYEGERLHSCKKPIALLTNP